ncbi:MAG: hypothetical protein F6K17_11940 [Okeania sp. SIO3C4]|nr:hypothetical protein [Okeania sp. SIO3C4]
MRTEMDYLVVENFLMSKSQQIPWEKDDSWKDKFELDRTYANTLYIAYGE